MMQFTKKAKQVTKEDKMNKIPTMPVSEKYTLKTSVCDF